MTDHGEVLQMLGQLQGTIDQVLDQAKRTNGSIFDHEKRLRLLEKTENVGKGQKSILTVAWIFVSGVVGAFITSHWSK